MKMDKDMKEVDQEYIDTFIRNLSINVNVPEETLKSQLTTALSEMQSQFPTQAINIIKFKALMKLKVDYKRRLVGKADPFIGIIIGADSARDPLTNLRDSQLQRYVTAKQQSDIAGDPTILEKEFTAEVIKLDIDSGQIIPLWPKFKKDGSPNKLAGTPMPNKEDSLIRVVYGIATPADKKEAKGFVLELRGKSCDSKLFIGEAVSFTAINKTQPTDTTYQLSSSYTEFLPCKNDYLQEGINKFGVAGLAEKMFKDCIMTWTDINNWIAEKKANPQSDPVPEKFKRGLAILPESMCVYQNLSPDAKGRIKINLCSVSESWEDTTVMCLAEKSLANSIDFAQNSKVLVAGRPWIPTPEKAEDNINMVMMTSGIFAYPGWRIPRVDTKPLAPDNVMQVAEAKGAVKVASQSNSNIASYKTDGTSNGGSCGSGITGGQAQPVPSVIVSDEIDEQDLMDKW